MTDPVAVIADRAVFLEYCDRLGKRPGDPSLVHVTTYEKAQGHLFSDVVVLHVTHRGPDYAALVRATERRIRR